MHRPQLSAQKQDLLSQSTIIDGLDVGLRSVFAAGEAIVEEDTLATLAAPGSA